MSAESARDSSDPAHFPPGDRSHRAPSADVLSLHPSHPVPADTGSLSKLLRALRFRHLSLLVALDDHRNLHRAAKAVHISQSTASEAIHDLEALFRSPLFDRVHTGMRPNELGGVVLAFARRTLGELKRVSTTADRRLVRADEPLVIGTSTDLSVDFVSDAMADMKRLRPELLVRLICESNDRLLDQLIAGDLGLAVGHWRQRLQPGIIDFEPLGHETLSIFARPPHPLIQLPTLSLRDLHRLAWVLPSSSSAVREVIDQLFRRAGMSTPENVVESDAIAMTLNMVLRNDFVTVLAERAVLSLVEDGKIARLPIAHNLLRLELGLLTRSGEPLSDAASEFRQTLRGYRDTLSHPASNDP